MRYLIIGNGYIGNYLKNKLPDAEIYKEKINPGCRTNATQALVRYGGFNPVVINCAGKTGRPNIDWCESNKTETFNANVLLPLDLAKACEKFGMQMIHIGSGCIYTGYAKEYTEDDSPNFYDSYYSRTKAISQELLEEFNNVTTLRVRMPIDETLGERNYITKVVGYAMKDYPMMVLQNSMTWLDDLVRLIEFIAKFHIVGTFNAVNDGSMSPIDILKLWKEYRDPELTWRRVGYQQVRETLSAGRSNCILSTEKLKKIGFEVNHIDHFVKPLIKDGK